MKPNKKQVFSFQQITSKFEYYCSYQERCYKEVESKFFEFNLSSDEKEKLLTYLIENNYINEERFAKSFARGKHFYKHWGRVRITNELKVREISVRIIQTALNEISEDDYIHNFNLLAEKNWNTITEKNIYKKKKKFVDFLLRKGYESNLIYEKLQELAD